MVDADLIRDDGTRIGINDRIKSNNYFGTVKFIGEVESTEGLWLGVEWDDPQRGRHNGIHNGKQYFTTKHATSGSFVRPKKVELGVTCFAALKDKYGRINEKNAGVDVEELYVTGSNNQITVVEMVGAEKINIKQSKLENLTDVMLTDTGVYGAGPQNDLEKFTPNIRELDISKNLISSWIEIVEICKQLEYLKLLDLSENYLQIPENPHTLQNSFLKIKVLCLNKMNYTWQQILQCSSMFPSLKQLHMHSNCLCRLSAPSTELQKVVLLNLECNDISQWDEILKLADLPNLKTLIISDNNIEKIYFPNVAKNGKTTMFRSLELLLVNNNRISEWSSINELNKLYSLTEVQLRGNPLMSTNSDETVRQLLIAKIGGLQTCQKTQVLAKERRGAEIDYLKRFGPDWVKAGGNEDSAKNNVSPEFLQQHPRYMELIQKLGAPEESEMKPESTKLKDHLVHIKITCPDHPDKGTVQKKLPQTMTVQKVKALAKRLFKIHAADVTVSYVSHRMEGPEIELDNELKQLYFYSIENDDILQVKW
ncbi:tubulin-specific chaperone E-like [Gigantopelta aegis]|uniref:tubulin-specific chaperone E-like n=1 Tax=Gigantopelta aegis TaxID=1735272 RepID=UPI001B88A3C5|nr:tubulin-specific chaperone E-like [Gigantopelta aegis]